MVTIFLKTNNLLQIENTIKKEVSILRLLASLVLIASTIFIGKMITDPQEIRAQQVTPAYAKWGRLAMEKVMEKYKNAQVIDYLHIGRVTGESTTTEKFKLWLKEQDREFGVYVNITFDSKTEEIQNIELTETDR